MRARKISVLILSIAGLMLATWIAVGQQPRRIDDLALINAGKTGEDWLTYGLTPQETRYSPLKQIDPSNVSRLGLAWSYDLGSGGGNQEGTPLEWNGIVYAHHELERCRLAVDARTGKERWRWDPEVNQHRGSSENLLRCRQSGNRDLSGQGHCARYRRASRSSRCRDGQAGVGSARRLPSRQLHDNDGPAHRERQSHRRRERR